MPAKELLLIRCSKPKGLYLPLYTWVLSTAIEQAEEELQMHLLAKPNSSGFVTLW